MQALGLAPFTELPLQPDNEYRSFVLYMEGLRLPPARCGRGAIAPLPYRPLSSPKFHLVYLPTCASPHPQAFDPQHETTVSFPFVDDPLPEVVSWILEDDACLVSLDQLERSWKGVLAGLGGRGDEGELDNATRSPNTSAREPGFSELGTPGKLG